MPSEHESENPLEIAICGDLAQHEHDIYDKLLGVPPGGECVLYCDGSADCPSGMTCSGGTCLYVFDDPRCGSGAP